MSAPILSDCTIYLRSGEKFAWVVYHASCETGDNWWTFLVNDGDDLDHWETFACSDIWRVQAKVRPS